MSRMSDTGIDAQQRALETREVTITIRLPPMLVDRVEELHATEPEFLEHVIEYALTRRSIYQHIRELELAEKSQTTVED